MERHSFFVQIDPDNRLQQNLSKLLFIQRGQDFFPGNTSHLLPYHILIRRERQTFRLLPKSEAIVFTVKTSIQKLVDVPVGERPNLVKEIKAWPREIASYKGRDLWARAVYGFCEGRPVSGHLSDVDLGEDDVGTMTRVSEY